jgi:hypothetical protein
MAMHFSTKEAAEAFVREHGLEDIVNATTPPGVITNSTKLERSYELKLGQP